MKKLSKVGSLLFDLGQLLLDVFMVLVGLTVPYILVFSLVMINQSGNYQYLSDNLLEVAGFTFVLGSIVLWMMIDISKTYQGK